MRESAANAEIEPEWKFGPIIIQDDFGSDSLRNVAQGYLEFEPYVEDYPAVYILYSEQEPKPEAYVGESAHLARRIQVHVKDRRRKKLDKVLGIGCKGFNKSATFHMESKLISCLLADGRYVLQNIRQTSGEHTAHDYFRKAYFEDEFFPMLWEELVAAGIVRMPLDCVANSDVYKLSPYKQLSASQNELVRSIIAFCSQHLGDTERAVFLIKGEAGTGKSVVLSSLCKQLADLAADKRSVFAGKKTYLLVNHSEQLKTYTNIAKRVKGLVQNRFMKPTTFVNRAKKGQTDADITIVDEGHLLLSQSDAFNAFEEANHLEEVIKHSRISIVVYDDRQVLKLKSYWDERRLKKIVSNAKGRRVVRLTEQFRMHADRSMIDWIDELVDGKRIGALPPAFQPDGEDGFEFLVFDDAEAMHQTIRARNDEWGLARMVATFDYEHKKDGGTYYVEEGAFKLPWNMPSDAGTWAERTETIEEVGSIYTVQGFDLNFAGVIIGPSITYDAKTDRLKIVSRNYKDVGAFKGRSDIPASKIPAIKERIILNSLNVLLKRPVLGLFVYASDAALRERLMELQCERDHDRDILE